MLKIWRTWAFAFFGCTEHGCCQVKCKWHMSRISVIVLARPLQVIYLCFKWSVWNWLRLSFACLHNFQYSVDVFCISMCFNESWRRNSSWLLVFCFQEFSGFEVIRFLFGSFAASARFLITYQISTIMLRVEHFPSRQGRTVLFDLRFSIITRVSSAALSMQSFVTSFYAIIYCWFVQRAKQLWI